MIEPTKINAVSKKYEEQNYKFRAFLKNRADYDEVDAQFLGLHNELFADYDCCKCANCCKAYSIKFNDDDIAAASRYLGKSESDFINEYLVESEEGSCDDEPDEGRYKTKSKPCPFLCDDGKCKIQECKPSSCKGFPFTDQPDRMLSMLSIIDFAEECPVVFEILERLKKLYRFRNR
jgi:hypothetical protein